MNRYMIETENNNVQFIKTRQKAKTIIKQLPSGSKIYLTSDIEKGGFIDPVAYN